MPGSRHAAHPTRVSSALSSAGASIRAHANAVAAPPSGPAPLAIVVLGCRVRLDAAERLSPGALARRVEMGARIYLERADATDATTVIIVSGGRRWHRDVEADAMARELALRGVPERAIVRERCSLSTRENARFTAEILSRRGIDSAVLVTCRWHMARAVVRFSQAGISVEPVAAADGADGAGRTGGIAPWPSRVWRWGAERVLTLA